MVYTQKIKLDVTDLAAYQYRQPVDAKQGDNLTRIVEITVLVNGAEYKPPQGSTAHFRALKPDGTCVDNPATILESGAIKVELTEQVLAVAGTVRADVVISEKENDRISTASFLIRVEAAPLGKHISSSNEFLELNQMLAKGNKLIADLSKADIRVSGGKIQATVNGIEWKDLVAIQDLVGPKGPPGGADGLVVQDNLLYLTMGGEIISNGITLPETGTGGLNFDALVFDDNGYLHIQMEGVDVVDPVYIGTGGGGGGGDTGSTIKLLNKMPSRNVNIVEGKEAIIRYNVTSTDSSDGSPTGDVYASWMVNGARVASQTVHQGDNSFDVSAYLTPAMENAVKLTVEDAYGSTRSFIWSVQVISYSLTWNLDPMAVHEEKELTIRLVPTGEGDKTVHVTCDGRSVLDQVVKTTGRTLPVQVPKQSHGAHVIKAWMEATSEGTAIKTDTLSHVGVWTDPGNHTPVVAVYTPEITMSKYATQSIPWIAYSPDSLTSEVTLTEDGQEVSYLTVDRTMQNWAYRATKTGVVTLGIACGAVRATVTATVNKLAYDIEPVTTGLAIDVDPSGHSNAEAGRSQFGYKDGSGVNHPFTFSDNFDWRLGGFQPDADGVTAFVVKRGTWVEADRSLFDDDAAANGKEIKLVFRATNARDYDAEMINCVSGNIGLVVQAQTAYLSSELASMDIPYCEDRKIEMDLNIEAASEDRLATVWLEGTPSRIMAYTANDNWLQPAPKKLRIGSPECDIWVYRLKAYNRSLTRYEIIDNFVADCADVDEMIARYKRNDIYNPDGSINVTKLTTANPRLHVITISTDRVTTGKKDSVVCDITHSYTAGGKAHEWTAVNAIHKGQGTSSAAYGEAALNLDLDLSKAESWTDGDGQPVTGYSMTDMSIPVAYFNIKLNVASSENANNVILADEYNDFQPFLTAARRENPKVRDTVEGHPCVVFITNTNTVPIKAGARTISPGQTLMYGCGDMNNSKKNNAVFGQDNEKYPRQCCVEILNNVSDQCRFKSADLSHEDYSGDFDFEFRYPKKPTPEMIEAFETMHAWVCSTDPKQATESPLPAPARINGTTYTNDTAAYRGAKFVSEFDQYFSRDAMLYHYLFIERHTMIDNRAKNVFLSYEMDPDVGDYRWNVCKDYDNDTGEGNDNEGGLSFTYGLEDTDSIRSKPVFNASDSVIWCNIRDFMQDDLERVFQSCEAAGAWDAKRILQHFADHQSARPEALVAEDMWGKYRSPFTINGNAAYLPMMQGNKTDQRTQFEIYQEGYMSSKYYGSVAVRDAITFRGNTPEQWHAVKPNGDITVKLYADAYQIIKYGSHSVRKRCKRGQLYTFHCPVAKLSDTEIYTYLASNITEVSSVAGLYCQYIDMGSASRLRRLSIGSGEPGYSNLNLVNLSIGNNRQLEYLDLRGTPNLEQALELDKLQSIDTLYLTGSGVTGVSFADASPVRVAHLSAVNSLIARNLYQLQDFALDGKNLKTIWVEGTPVIDTYALMQAATALARGRLPDVAWEAENADVLLRLARLAGLDEAGSTAPDFVLEGACHLAIAAQEELDVIMPKWPGLQLTYGELVQTFTVTFKRQDTGEVYHTQRVRQYGPATNPVTAGLIEKPTREPTVEYQYSFIGWDKDFSSVTSDMEINAVFSELPREYRVRWWIEDRMVQSEIVKAHGSSSYKGEEPKGPAESIWMGWDTPTADIVKDTEVHAVFVTPQLPESVASDYDFLYSDDPADKSAYTLSEFYGIITKGLAKQYFKKMDRIKIVPVTDVYADESFILQLEAFKHYKLAGKDQFSECFFGMVGLMNSTRGMNSTNDNTCSWGRSTMFDYLNNVVFDTLPQQWKSMIKPVDVLASAGGTSARIERTPSKLFLRSQSEVGFDTKATPYKDEIEAGAEEITFPCYTDNSSRIKKPYNGTGSANWWWLRSPHAGGSSSFCFVNHNGASGHNGAYTSFGVSFGFCF